MGFKCLRRSSVIISHASTNQAGSSTSLSSSGVCLQLTLISTAIRKKYFFFYYCRKKRGNKPCWLAEGVAPVGGIAGNDS